MTDRILLIDRATLPLTYAAVRANFNDPALRRRVFEAACYSGRVAQLSRSVALTASGRAALDAVQRVLSGEWSERGFDSCYVGEADPRVYGPNRVAAYLDQPARPNA
jgi:hypothetical protein